MKVRFAIVGTNKISDVVTSAAKLDDRFEAYAVYSRTQESGDTFAQRHSIEKVYTSFQQMLSDEMVDAVYIASPNACHASQTIEALNAGKHVLCEKAFASNLKEAQMMVDAAQCNSRLLMEAIKTIPTPNFQSVKANISKIGKPRRYFSSYCQYSSRYDAFRRGEVLNAFKPDLSNGALVDIGVYAIYPMVALFGMPDSFDASSQMLHSGVDGQGSVTFHYKDMDAVVIYSKIADSSLQTEIQGEDGTITLDRVNIINKVTLTPRGGNSIDITVPHTVEVESAASLPNFGNDYYYEIKEFIDTLQDGRTESQINSLECSLQVMTLLTQIRQRCGIVYPADKE